VKKPLHFRAGAARARPASYGLDAISKISGRSLARARMASASRLSQRRDLGRRQSRQR